MLQLARALSGLSWFVMRRPVQPLFAWFWLAYFVERIADLPSRLVFALLQRLVARLRASHPCRACFGVPCSPHSVLVRRTTIH